MQVNFERKVAVEGSIRTSSYTQNGQKRYKTEINAQQVLFLNTAAKQGKRDDDDQYPTKHMQDKANGYQPEPDDGGEEIDIPF